MPLYSSNENDHDNNKSPRLEAVIHIYNPSYSGGGDQEDHSLRPA
jgi:hypothetical protein